MKPFGSAGLFWERPFGNVPTLGADDDVVAAMAANDGSIKPVVTAVVRGDGVGGARRTEYAYQGRPYRGKRNWGLVGFAATRVKDAASGVVTYLQHRLDDPHFVRKSGLESVLVTGNKTCVSGPCADEFDLLSRRLGSILNGVQGRAFRTVRRCSADQQVDFQGQHYSKGPDGRGLLFDKHGVFRFFPEPKP